MAVPLRKAAGGYESYSSPARIRTGRQRPEYAGDTAAKRLVRRQIRSNAEFRRTAAWMFLAMSSLLFLLGISYIFVKAGVSRLNYQINTLQAENAEILLENDKIRGEIAELRSLDRIEAIATQELGMVKNEAVEYMVLSTTVVAEGKIRTEEEALTEEEPKSASSLAALLDFFLSRK